MSLFWEFDYNCTNTFRIHSLYVLFNKGHEKGNSCPFHPQNLVSLIEKKKLPSKLLTELPRIYILLVLGRCDRNLNPLNLIPDLRRESQ